jgi:hypothetical protein
MFEINNNMAARYLDEGRHCLDWVNAATSGWKGCSAVLLEPVELPIIFILSVE